MDIATIPYSRLDPGNAVARDYCLGEAKALALFAHDYRDPRALKPLAEQQRAFERPALGELLADYNREVGGDAKRAATLDDGLCVISGQQVGLLLGPAYTTYKLFTVINAARRLEDELGTPVTPVFWIESEDHDWAEVNRFFLRERRFRMDVDVAAGTPVARIDADPEPGAEVPDQSHRDVDDRDELLNLDRLSLAVIGAFGVADPQAEADVGVERG